MDFKTFLDNISLHEYVKNEVLKLVDEHKDEYSKYLSGLADIKKGEATYQELCNKYSLEDSSLNILAVYLLAAFNAYPKYQRLGISDKVFIDTMKAFTRFVGENYERKNKYYFDRGFWTYRQTSMSLFRLGVLEFEFVDRDDVKKISIHIPSDSLLTKENIDNSFHQLEEFIVKYYPEYLGVDKYCDSWLLSERLKEHLKEGSRILLFQSYFDILEFDPYNMDVYEWIFKSTKEVRFEDLPEKTSLQRSVKQSFLKGRFIGKALGIVKK